MKLINKTLPLIVTAVAVPALFLGVNFASAETSTDTLVDRIASKFSLEKTEVQKVVDDFRGEKRAERGQRLSDRLQDQVDAGKITAEQKTVIENKLSEHRQKMDDLRNQSLTEEQRREQMNSLRDELKTWAEDNNIDLGLVMPMGGKGMMKGMRGGHGNCQASQS